MTQLSTKKQSGTALITVVLIAAVIIVLVMESVKTIQYQKQLSSNLINRDQAYSYLMGMEELAKVLLKRAFDNIKEKNVHPNQPWAQEKIQFPFDGGMMVASVKDMQSCFNLNTIADMNAGNNQNGNDQGNNDGRTNNQPRLDANGFAAETVGQKMFEELLSKINRNTELSPKALAAATRDWLDEDTNPNGPDGAEDDYYMGLEVPYRTANSLLAHTSELRSIKDFNGQLYNQLLPHICVLPESNINQINVNTVSQESAILIYTLLDSPNVTLDRVEKALANRPKQGYESIDEFFTELGGASQQFKNSDQLSVTSSYFQVDAKAELGDTRVYMKSLFIKDENNNFKLLSRYFGKE